MYVSTKTAFPPQVLTSIPWDKVDIKVLTIEIVRVKQNLEQVGSFEDPWPKIKKLMESNGYHIHKLLRFYGEYSEDGEMPAFDAIFVKNDFEPPK